MALFFRVVSSGTIESRRPVEIQLKPAQQFLEPVMIESSERPSPLETVCGDEHPGLGQGVFVQLFDDEPHVHLIITLR